MLNIGERRTARVPSHLLWVDTRIDLVAGEEYRFTAKGEWKDWYIGCGPDGYDSTNILQVLAERLRRMPQERWFALIGALDEDPATAFHIGSRTTRVMPRNGRLTCFANDLVGLYFNNYGAVDLTIERLR